MNAFSLFTLSVCLLAFFSVFRLAIFVTGFDTSLCKTSTLGKEYKGTLFVTLSGIVCQRWDSQSPHTHSRDQASIFPDATVAEAENYCRNPDNEPEGPWCYTTDAATRWQYCDVRHCEELTTSLTSNGFGVSTPATSVEIQTVTELYSSTSENRTTGAHTGTLLYTNITTNTNTVTQPGTVSVTDTSDNTTLETLPATFPLIHTSLNASLETQTATYPTIEASKNTSLETRPTIETSENMISETQPESSPALETSKNTRLGTQPVTSPLVEASENMTLETQSMTYPLKEASENMNSETQPVTSPTSATSENGSQSPPIATSGAVTSPAPSVVTETIETGVSASKTLHTTQDRSSTSTAETTPSQSSSREICFQWTPCSMSCGTGTQRKLCVSYPSDISSVSRENETSVCSVYQGCSEYRAVVRPCLVAVCPARWSGWSQWSCQLTDSCHTQTGSRQRVCLPVPALCQGKGVQTITCDTVANCKKYRSGYARTTLAAFLDVQLTESDYRPTAVALGLLEVLLFVVPILALVSFDFGTLVAHCCYGPSYLGVRPRSVEIFARRGSLRGR